MELIAIVVIALLALLLMTGGAASEEEPSVVVIQLERPRQRAGGCLQFVSFLAITLLLAVIFSSIS